MGLPFHSAQERFSCSFHSFIWRVLCSVGRPNACGDGLFGTLAVERVSPHEDSTYTHQELLHGLCT